MHAHNHKELEGGHNMSLTSMFFWLGNIAAFIWAMREDIFHALIIVFCTTTFGWVYQKVLKMVDKRNEKRDEKYG